MVTINEEFVANEQLNNYQISDQASTPGVQPVAVLASAHVTTDSADSSDPEGGPENGKPGVSPADQEPKPAGKKSHGNHQTGKNKKQKRSGEAHKPPAKHGNKDGASTPSPAPVTAAPEPAPIPPSTPAAPSAPAPTPAPTAVSPSAPQPAKQPLPTPNATAFPHMEAVTRVLALPIVDSGVSIVSGVYSKVKNVNPVVQWSLGTAEGAVRSSVERSLSLLGPLSGPLSVVDSLLCRGLDMVEYNVPLITLPPELLVNVGRDYMSMRVVDPVRRMTATNARRAETLAARALDSADRYVDKYLPGDAATENGDAIGAGGAALQRADRLSRKLQRRITRLTLAEARALKRDTAITLNTLVYFAETLVKDPRAFVEQCRTVWNHLSENEPENQVPPETLEERLALLVREVARRVVHLANYTAASANTPVNHVFKSVREEGTKMMTFAQSQLEKVHMPQVLGDVNNYTHQLLERLAHLLAGLRSSSHTMGRPFPHANTNNIAIVN